MRARVSLAMFAAIPFALLAAACASPFSSAYFLQQAGAKSGDGGSSEPGGSGDTQPEDPGAGSDQGLVSVFSVIAPDGALREDLLTAYPEALSAIRERMPPSAGPDSSTYAGLLIRASFTSQNVPSLLYEAGAWSLGGAEKLEYLNNGPNTKAGSNTISSVVYYEYRGANPFYGSSEAYNTATYDSSGEARLSRFSFYRFTGKTAAPSLDNMLVAVDRYSSLVYCFAKPVRFDTILGNKVPREWAAVDSVCVDADGRRHRFYEYDPAGYVRADGVFVMSDWYKGNLAAGVYDPRYSGRSPYAVPIGGAGTGSDIVLTAAAPSASLSDVRGYYALLRIEPAAGARRCALYRRDDRSEQWLQLGEAFELPANTAREIRDYDALVLKSPPRYKAAVLDSDGTPLAESAAVDGPRMLSPRETAIIGLYALRASISQLWYVSGSPGGGLKAGSIAGGGGSYHNGIDRNGFFGFNYRRYLRYDRWEYGVAVLDGTCMKDDGGGAVGLDKKGLWTHEGSAWPTDAAFNPRLDAISLQYLGVSCSLEFRDLRIDNNDGNEPSWTGGSLYVRTPCGQAEFGPQDGLPFLLFMDDAALAEALGTAGYAQR